MVNVDPAKVIQFSEQVHMFASQTTSRLSPFAKVIPVTGEKAAYDGLGTVEASAVTGQYQDVKFADIEHKRRRIIGTQFYVALPVDQKDLDQILTDPSGEYAMRITQALARQMDITIAIAAFADVFTGKNMDTLLTAANDGVITVDATSGLTKEKLDEINENYIDNEISIEEGQRKSLSITGEEHTDLMGEAEFLSIDFMDAKPLSMTGEIKRANGNEITLFGANGSRPILATAAAVRSCISMAQNGIVLGIWDDLSIEIQDRPDKVTTKQIIATMTIGATRTEGARIQKVNTTIS